MSTPPPFAQPRSEPLGVGVPVLEAEVVVIED
jgi:hypothetical protein